MTENEPQLPEDIRKALKMSPTFSPPESFYQGVLEKIERKRTAVPWYLGYPMKGLATACVLMVLVLVAREKKSTNAKAAHIDTEPLQGLSNTAEVQNRLNRPISNLVENPSPFEEEDAELRRQINAESKKSVRIRKAALQSPPPELTVAAVPSAVGGALSSRASVPAQLQERKKTGTNAEWKGGFSGITTFRTVTVRTSEDWQALWLAHTSYIVPPPPAPDVDFGNTMVVGIFDGSKPSAGYTIEVVGIQTTPDKIIVTYRESNPPAGVATAQVNTQPYYLRVIPKTSLPVIFEKAS